MSATFVLPLFPLEEQVLLPGEELPLPPDRLSARIIIDHARGFGGALIASLVDGEAVHEVAVTALLTDAGAEGMTIHGVSRCRLLDVVAEDVPLVRAERLPEPRQSRPRSDALRKLLLARFTKLRRNLRRRGPSKSAGKGLSALTWRITAELGFSAEQQQGLLCVPDPVTRGRLLLAAVRELERRERFLRPFARFRTDGPWN
jgi:Lon protease-like protein